MFSIDYSKIEKIAIEDRDFKIEECKEKKELLNNRIKNVLEGKNIENEVCEINDQYINEIDSQLDILLNMDIRYRKAYDLAYNNYINNESLFDGNEIIPASILSDISKDERQMMETSLKVKLKKKKELQEELSLLDSKIDEQEKKKSGIMKKLRIKEREQ